MTPVGALRAVRRRWWLPAVLVVIAVVAVLAIGTSSNKTQVLYKAKAILIQNPVGNPNSQINLQEAALEATVGRVPVLAAATLHYGGNPTILASEVTATADVAVGTLTIEVDGHNGGRAAGVADAFANALNQNLTQNAINSYQTQVAQVEAHLNDLQNQIAQYENASDPVSQAKLGSAEDEYRLAYTNFQQLAAQGQPAPTFVLLQKAAPVAAGGTHPPLSLKVRLAVGAVVALLLGLVLAIALDLLFPRINDREDAEREFGTVVLAEVPDMPRKMRADGLVQAFERPGWESFHEAYRMLRSAIFLFSAAGSDQNDGSEGEMPSGPQVILVTSPTPAEGKSTTVANLALAMAESGRQTLICNVDFRAPTVPQMFGMATNAGLTDLLSGTGDADLKEIVHPTHQPRVSLVHSGRDIRDAAHLVASRGRSLIQQARKLADVVLLDTAPLLVVSDSSELLPVADAVILVARAGRTTRDSARRAYDLLARAEIPVLGVVLVGSRSPTSSYYGTKYGKYGKYGARYGAARPAVAVPARVGGPAAESEGTSEPERTNEAVRPEPERAEPVAESPTQPVLFPEPEPAPEPVPVAALSPAPETVAASETEEPAETSTTPNTTAPTPPEAEPEPPSQVAPVPITIRSGLPAPLPPRPGRRRRASDWLTVLREIIEPDDDSTGRGGPGQPNGPAGNGTARGRESWLVEGARRAIRRK